MTRQKHHEAFARLAWAENERRGGYLSSWAFGRRVGLWLAAWVVEPSWLPLPNNRHNPPFTEPLDD